MYSLYLFQVGKVVDHITNIKASFDSALSIMRQARILWTHSWPTKLIDLGVYASAIHSLVGRIAITFLNLVFLL